MAARSALGMVIVTAQFRRSPPPACNSTNSTQFARWKWRCWPSPLFAVPSWSRFRVAASRSYRSNSRRSDSKTKKVEQDEGDEDDLSDDAFEALFSQLEKDLEADEISEDEEDDATIDEEAARFEEELRVALSDIEDDEEAETSLLDAASKLEKWQLHKLAGALERGRRKISVKGLAEELGLDRLLVLHLLRDPPPQLLLAGNALIGKDDAQPLESESKCLETASPTLTELGGPKSKMESPVYITQGSWNRQKRLKKVHVATLEKVYRRTRRPTDTMVDSIVQVTRLPRKAVLKWFADKRQQEGFKFIYRKAS